MSETVNESKPQEVQVEIPASSQEVTQVQVINEETNVNSVSKGEDSPKSAPTPVPVKESDAIANNIEKQIVEVNKVAEKISEGLKSNNEILNKITDNNVAKMVLREVDQNASKVLEKTLDTIQNKHIGKVIELLVDTPEFKIKVEKTIKEILKDGKVDLSDIPELVHLIIECYNNVPKVKLTKDELPDFVVGIFNYIDEKYKIIPEDKRGMIQMILLSSVKLVLMAPKIKPMSCWCWK